MLSMQKKTHAVFFDHVKERLISEPQGDYRLYVAAEDLSDKEIEIRMEYDHFDLKKNLKSFRPTSCNSEKLFSFNRISKIFVNVAWFLLFTLGMFF